ncbi:hypothetical protein MasN3_16080 [Massilia varians]|uniref:Uncharacterized protein n=1 Tax=Massilia varians TaxID=457921 RepID=A0ABN6TDM4_9BURK|nr:hypothetical protein [Massilia varians]BDT58114.1 hypothetical protein MasN3_16080 [Massilia varians]
MTELVVPTFDVAKLSTAALELLRAAVLHARANQCVKLHTMQIDEFCRLAGLPPTTTKRFLTLLKEARKALVIVEVIDTEFPHRDDLPYSSWPVFKESRINGSQIAFEIYNQTLEDSILASLPMSKHLSDRDRASERMAN